MFAQRPLICFGLFVTRCYAPRILCGRSCLAGRIPPELGQLVALEILWLARNELDGKTCRTRASSVLACDGRVYFVHSSSKTTNDGYVTRTSFVRRASTRLSGAKTAPVDGRTSYAVRDMNWSEIDTTCNSNIGRNQSQVRFESHSSPDLAIMRAQRKRSTKDSGRAGATSLFSFGLFFISLRLTEVLGPLKVSENHLVRHRLVHAHSFRSADIAGS